MNLIDSLNNMSIIELIMFAAGIIFFWAKLEASTKANQKAITTEIQHVKDLMEINHQNIKEDISRLEKKQEESNKIKERLAMQEVIVANLQTAFDVHIRSTRQSEE